MKSNYNVLGNYIRLIDTRNKDGITDRVLGINIDKFFMPSVANVIGTDLRKYKLITKGKFACNPMHVGRDEQLPIALYEEEEPALVSPAYFMFEIIDNTVLDENYLMMWFRRPEFDRICWLHTDGSVRGGITWGDICRMELPIPDIDKQRKIVNGYKAIIDRIELKRKLNDNLAETASTLFQKMFISNPNKKQWSVGTFSDLIKSTVGGDWGQEAPTGNYTQEISCIRGTDISSLNYGSISTAPKRFILAKNFVTKKVKPNDLVVEISGGSPTQATGRIALVPQQVLDYRGDNLICSNFCRLVTVEQQHLYYFLQYWLYLYRAGRMFDYENSSTGLKNFDFSSFVEKEPVPIPPSEILQQYDRAAKELYKQLFTNGFEIEALRETQGYILPRIMLHGI
ncbi:MAG: restriction endonuclease subunit S [Butyrivibrio sp.]|nr:restriction endonuclease subunit S [Butyrivibrio sp.]